MLLNLLVRLQCTCVCTGLRSCCHLLVRAYNVHVLDGPPLTLCFHLLVRLQCTCVVYLCFIIFVFQFLVCLQCACLVSLFVLNIFVFHVFVLVNLCLCHIYLGHFASVETEASMTRCFFWWLEFRIGFDVTTSTCLVLFVSSFFSLLREVRKFRDLIGDTKPNLVKTLVYKNSSTKFTKLI